MIKYKSRRPRTLWCSLSGFRVSLLSVLSAYIVQTEHFYDLTGSLTFLTLMAMSYASSAKTPRQTLATSLVLIWTLRLGTFLVLR